jgi:hypothetical protein
MHSSSYAKGPPVAIRFFLGAAPEAGLKTATFVQQFKRENAPTVENFLLLARLGLARILGLGLAQNFGTIRATWPQGRGTREGRRPPKRHLQMGDGAMATEDGALSRAGRVRWLRWRSHVRRQEETHAYASVSLAPDRKLRGSPAGAMVRHMHPTLRPGSEARRKIANASRHKSCGHVTLGLRAKNVAKKTNKILD